MKPATIELRIGRVVVHGGEAGAIDRQVLAAAIAEQLGRHWNAQAAAPAMPEAARGARKAGHEAGAPTALPPHAVPAWSGPVADAVAARWQPGSGGRRG